MTEIKVVYLEDIKRLQDTKVLLVIASHKGGKQELMKLAKSIIGVLSGIKCSQIRV